MRSTAGGAFERRRSGGDRAGILFSAAQECESMPDVAGKPMILMSNNGLERTILGAETPAHPSDMLSRLSTIKLSLSFVRSRKVLGLK